MLLLKMMSLVEEGTTIVDNSIAMAVKSEIDLFRCPSANAKRRVR